MSTIKPFKAIHPHSENAPSVVSVIEEMSIDVAKGIRQINPQSFIHLLVPEIDSNLSGKEKRENAFKKIKENLNDFIEQGSLVKDEDLSIYIYQVSENGKKVRGVWTCTSINDLKTGKIKKHEHTKPEREERISSYLENTGIDANPVLITYKSSKKIDQLVASACTAKPQIEFEKDLITHSIWNISNPQLIELFVNAFSEIDSVYIADGHHRAAAALRLTTKGHDNDFSVDSHFSTIYIPSDQLEVYSFNRLVKCAADFETNRFIEQLSQNFSSVVLTQDKNAFDIGVYINKKWYYFIAKPHLLTNSTILQRLSIFLLEKYIFEPLLDINSSEIDDRVDFISGTHSKLSLQSHVDSSEYSMAFLLRPIAIKDLMEVADMNGIMPPKSTWFEPKFPVGLLINQLEL